MEIIILKNAVRPGRFFGPSRGRVSEVSLY